MKTIKAIYPYGFFRCRFAYAKYEKSKFVVYYGYGCREEFHYVYDSKKKHKYIVSCYPLREDIIKIENNLKLNKKSKVIGLVAHNMYLIKPADFWFENGLRRSLFTALLSGKRYFRSKKSQENLKKFMSGKTKPTPRYLESSQWLRANYDGLNFV